MIVDKDSSAIEHHAQKALRRQLELEFKHGNFMPMGIPGHNAVFPNRCDECGGTFWASEQYAEHPGCKGSGSKLGFSP